MKPTKVLVLICFVITISLLSLIAQAQIKVSNSVIGSGGGISSDANFKVTATLGQAIVGTLADSSNSMNIGFWAQSGGVVTSVEKIETESIPDKFRLDQNYPNPFNPTTTIAFALPKQTEVSIKLFDLQGRIVSILVDNEMAAGEYQIVFDAKNIPSGVYFYRIDAEGFVQTKKLTLLK